MKTSLIVFGVVFFVLGIVGYYLPDQTAAATITTVGEGNTDTRTSYTSYAIPWQLTFALSVIGGVLFIMGVMIPTKNPEIIDETKENVTSGTGKHRKVLHEEHHVRRSQ